MDEAEKIQLNKLIEQFRYMLEEANFNLAKERTKYALLNAEYIKLQEELQETIQKVVRTQDELQRYKTELVNVE